MVWIKSEPYQPCIGIYFIIRVETTVGMLILKRPQLLGQLVFDPHCISTFVQLVFFSIVGMAPSNSFRLAHASEYQLVLSVGYWSE
jgi:hypothetical protein